MRCSRWTRFLFWKKEESTQQDIDNLSVFVTIFLFFFYTTWARKTIYKTYKLQFIARKMFLSVCVVSASVKTDLYFIPIKHEFHAKNSKKQNKMKPFPWKKKLKNQTLQICLWSCNCAGGSRHHGNLYSSLLVRIHSSSPPPVGSKP